MSNPNKQQDIDQIKSEPTIVNTISITSQFKDTLDPYNQFLSYFSKSFWRKVQTTKYKFNTIYS